jgi:2-isopropylmalate synthase
MGEAHITLECQGMVSQGRGASTDIVEASIKAYINAVNRLFQLAAARGTEITTAKAS